MTYGITFNGKHSWNDFGLRITDREIGFPSKEKIKVKVPFSNVEYDFSELYGSQTYTDRELKYSFKVIEKTGLNVKERINLTKSILANWFMSSHGKQKLYDDAIPGYYFLAEVEGDMSFQENWDTGVLTATFNAYPFMICDHPEGYDIWDEFNFELDISQQVQFVVNGSLQVTLINPGVPDVIPNITTTSAMTILKDGITYNVPAGESQSSDFALHSGENTLNISGNGSISFLFYKELI